MPDDTRKPIFISYRRSDEPFAAGFLYDKLVAAFGREQVFKDVDTFEPGDDFPEELARYVAECDVFLAVIGPQWLTATDELGRRIDNPMDWVRIEIASALKEEKRVVPVLVGDADIPKPEDLPEDLKRLTRKQVVRITPERMGAEADRLVVSLEGMLDRAAQERTDAALKAEAEAERRAEEEAARAREEAARAQEAQLRASQPADTVVSDGQVTAMRAIQNWDHIKPRGDIDEHRDHIARFPEDQTAQYAHAALEALVWKGTEKTSPRRLEAFLQEFPEGAYAIAAQARLEELRVVEAEAAKAEERRKVEEASWLKVAASDEKAAILRFLEQFPDGTYEDDAKKRLQELSQFSRRGLLLGGGAVAGAAGLGVWQMQPGQALWRALGGKVYSGVFAGNQENVRSIAFSPDGKRVLVGRDEGLLAVMDLNTFEIAQRFLGHVSPVFSASFSPDGERILSGGSDNDTLRLWDVSSGNVVQSFGRGLASVRSVDFAPGGDQALSGHVDGTVRFWHVASGNLIAMFDGNNGPIWSAKISSDGSRAIAGTGGSMLLVWDLRTRNRILQRPVGTNISSVAVSPTGQNAIFGGRNARIGIFDLLTGDTLRYLDGHSAWVHSVALSSTGEIALSGSDDRTVRLWNVSTGEALQIFAGHSNNVSSVAFSPSGNSAVSGSFDGTVRLWDLREYL